MLHRTWTQQDVQGEDNGCHDGFDDGSNEREEDINPARRKGKDTAEQNRIITYTAFDAYFANIAAASQTSTNVFSNLVPPLSSEEYSTAIHRALCKEKRLHPEAWSDGPRALHFSRFARELEEGFNLLLYGFGSKRNVLNQFVIEICSKRGHTVVVNGFLPDFTLKDMLYSVENIPGVLSMPLLSLGVEGQTRRIYDFFAHSAVKHHVYVVIHNIDAPAFRTSRAKSCLSVLALHPYIHLIASVDHVNAPLMWSTMDASMRKSETTTEDSILRGFAWLWHDVTTLASYDLELSYADHSSISGGSAVHTAPSRKQREAGGVAQNGFHMTETAALHILASVTQKAKKLFVLMGAQQLGRMEEAEEYANDAQQNALGYDILFVIARDNFIATNDTALRSLLSEFRDHGLVVGIQGGSGGESLWITLRKERLTSVLMSLSRSNEM